MRKITPMVIGTITFRRAIARCMFSNEPPQKAAGTRSATVSDGRFSSGPHARCLDVATERIEADVDSALQAFTADQCRAFAQFHLGDVT